MAYQQERESWIKQAADSSKNAHPFFVNDGPPPHIFLQSETNGIIYRLDISLTTNESKIYRSTRVFIRRQEHRYN